MNFANPTVMITALIILAALVIIGLMLFGFRRNRTARLREHFGNEYDRTVEAAGSRSRAENVLVSRAEEVKQFDIRPLTAAERQRFTSDWQKVEQRFVDRPVTSAVEADELITNVMRTRGYPMAEFDKHAEYLSVKHPGVVEHYRAGHDIITRHGKGTASTEDLRQAVLHYRALFDELVNDGDVPRSVTTQREMIEEEERPRA